MPRTPIHRLTTAFACSVALCIALPCRAADAPAIAVTPPQRATPVDFATEVLPILQRNCIACHGEKSPKADLSLETPDSMRKGGENGPALVNGESAKSLLLLAASHQRKPTMPPANNKVNARDLTPAELGLLKLWIDQGAKGSAPTANDQPIARHAPPVGFSPIYSIVVTPDGRYAICSRGNQLLVYDLRARRLSEELSDVAARELTDAPAHEDLIRTLALSAGGNLLASGGYRTVKIWKREPTGERARFETVDAPGAVAISPDGKSLAIGEASGVIRLWNLGTGKPEREYKGHTAPISAIAFSHDGARLFAAADAKVRVWNASDATSQGEWAAASPVTALLALGNGDRVVTGCREGQIQLWDVAAATKPADAAAPPAAALRQWRPTERAITALRGASTGEGHFISTDQDGRLYFWDAAADAQRAVVSHEVPVFDAAVSDYGSRIVTVGAPFVRVFDAKTDHHQIIAIRGDGRMALDLTDLRTRESMAKALFEYRKQDASEAKQQSKRRDEDLKKAQEALTKAEEERDNKTKAAEQPRKDLASAEEAETATRETYEKAKGEVEALQGKVKDAKDGEPETEKLRAQLKDAQKALNDLEKTYRDARRKREQVTNSTRGAIEAADKAVELVDTLTKQLARVEQFQKDDAALVEPADAAVKSAEEAAKKLEDERKAAEQALQQDKTPLAAVAISPDGHTIAVGGASGGVQLYDSENGAPLDVLAGHEKPVVYLTYLQNSDLVSVDAGGRVIVHRVASHWALDRIIGGPEHSEAIIDRVLALAFSPDGKTLAVGSGLPARRGELKLWNVADGALARDLSGAHSDTVQCVAYSPDGKLLATGSTDQTIKLMSLEDGRVVRTLEGHTGHVLSVAISSDGKMLASSGADRAVKLWEVATGEQIRTYPGNYYRIGPFRGAIGAVSFVGATEHLICACGDATARLLRTGREQDIRVYRADSRSYLHAAAATPDNAMVLTGGQDGVLHLWDTFNGRIIQSFAGP